MGPPSRLPLAVLVAAAALAAAFLQLRSGAAEEDAAGLPDAPAATSTSVTVPVAAPLPRIPPSTTPGSLIHAGHEGGAWAARSDGELAVFASPGAAEPELALPPATVLGTPTVVLVRHEWGAWLRVALPGRPNGREGWVRADAVEEYPVARRVEVDLARRLLTVREGEELLLTTSVAVGSDRSPTPPGSFFVTDAVQVTSPSGPWGAYAFGLSARSDTVTEFNGGDGIIGIHGTNRPESIGQAASLGCVRVPNEAMAELWELVTVGTPVEIRA